MTTTPTDQQLRDTYRREQPHRIDWPKDYAQGMADPIIARLVDMLTRRQIPAFGRRKAPRGGLTLRATAAPSTQPRPLDQKQRASGERDEPDTEQ